MYSAEELMESEKTFHHQYGLTLAQWATIEQRMFFWFLHASGLAEDMARGIFYSSKNFNGRADMLEAAVDYSTVLDENAKSVAAAIIKRCRAYSAFRNKITHGESAYDFRKDSVTFKQMLLIEGKEVQGKAAEDAISVDYLAWGWDRLRELSKLTMDSLQAAQAKNANTLQECLAQLEQLPAGLYPNPRNQKKSKQEPPPQPSRERPPWG